MMDKTLLIQNLKKLDLNGREISILANLITMGPMKIADLSKRSGIPRSSIYRYVAPLEEKGLVNWVMGLRSNLLSIGNFEVLSHSVGLKRKQISEQEKALESIVDFTKIARNKNFGKTTVNYYEGVNGIRQLMWNNLRAEGEIKIFTNATRINMVGQKWLQEYCLEYVRKGHSERVLCDINYAKNAYTKFGGRAKYFAPVNKYNEVSEERVFKSSLLEITGEMYIYDDVVATYSWENGYLVGTEIISKYIASTQHSIFDVLWNMTSSEDNIKNYPGQS